MSNKKFKVGDRVTCSVYLYTVDYKYTGMIGTFGRYNKYGGDIVYINFGQFAETISCFTEGVELLPRKNEQLLFNFMNE